MATSPPPPNPNPNPKRIIICGGGVIGACTAYFLSQPPNHHRITLIEKSPTIASAASGKAGGFLALDWCDSSPLSSLARPSFLIHRSLSHLLHGPQSYSYRPLHTLSLSLTPNPNPNPNPSTLPSWIDGPISGTPRTIGTVETTAQVHPEMFTRRMAEVAAENGVEVVVGEEVERVVVEGGKVTGVVVVQRGGERRVVEAEVVVLAMGPWSARSEILAALFRVSGLKAHSIVVRPSPVGGEGVGGGGDGDEITPHALFLSYQDVPGGKMLDPEVYPRPTGELRNLFNFELL